MTGHIKSLANCDCGKPLRGIWCYSGNPNKHTRLEGYGACPSCGVVYKITVEKKVV